MRIIEKSGTDYLSKKLHFKFDKRFKIALAQLEVNESKVMRFKIQKSILEAAKLKADLIVFPEDSYFGVIRGSEVTESLHQIDEFINHLKFLSFRYEIEILAAIPFRENQFIYNSSLHFRMGRLENVYKKTKLWLSEIDDFKDGEIKDLQISHSTIGNIGQTICWDLSCPEIFREYSKIGADLIINQAFWHRDRTKSLLQKFGPTKYLWPYTDYQMVNNFCVARANESGKPIVFVNAAGEYYSKHQDQKYRPIGLSQIVFPGIGVIAKAPRNRECLLIVDLPDYRDIIEDYRIMYRL